MATALATLMSVPSVALARHPTPVDELRRFTVALGRGAPRIYAKRDDLLDFAFGGNKVRKLQTVAAEALAAGADTLVTCGGVQSNHARVTAAAGAALGMRVVLVLNGREEDSFDGNAALDRLFGAEVRLVGARDERAAVMDQVARELADAGRRPFIVPLGASTPTGAMGFARGVAELAASTVRPDVIVHASSSGGTQAGIVAGCALLGLGTRVVGVSADEPSASLKSTVRSILGGIAERLGARSSTVGADEPLDVDDTFVGEGYGIPTRESTEAQELLARTEGIAVDGTYGAKALAGLVARVRRGEFSPERSVLFWITGQQIVHRHSLPVSSLQSPISNSHS